MKKIKLGSTSLEVPQIALGCMRFNQFTPKDMAHFIHTALDLGINFFDHADIYGNGDSERVFGAALKSDPSIKREDIIIQTKCGIILGSHYDNSKKHILESVDAALERLQTDYIDILLIHRPDALVEPEEVAEAFDELVAAGKVRYFGVSNHKPMQIELLKKYVRQPLLIDQLQFSVQASTMVANGMEVNMVTDGAVSRDEDVLDYCRLHDITIQAWSPYRTHDLTGHYIGDRERFPELNQYLDELAEKYHSTPTAIAAAWILRHPAHIQMLSGSTRESRLKEIASACDITLTREEWYKLYLSAGHPLP